MDLRGKKGEVDPLDVFLIAFLSGLVMFFIAMYNGTITLELTYCILMARGSSLAIAATFIAALMSR